MVPSVLYPSYALQSVVARYECYHFTDSLSSGFQLVFSPSLINDFIFSSGAKPPLLFSSRCKNPTFLPAGTLLSQVKSNISIRFHSDSYVFRVVFHPGVVSALYQISINRLGGRPINLGAELNSELRNIQKNINLINNAEEKVRIIERHLEKRMSIVSSNKLFYPKLNDFLLRNGYNTSVHKMSELFFTCPRHFNRLLKAELGFSAQDFLTIHRITRVLKYLWKYPDCRLINVAYKFGFSDQSHFTNNFRRVMGASPRQYQKEIGKKMSRSVHFFDDHSFGTGISLAG